MNCFFIAETYKYIISEPYKISNEFFKFIFKVNFNRTFRQNSVEVTVTEARRGATELWTTLAASDLQVIVPYPLRHPAQSAVAVKESTPEAQSTQCGVKMCKGCSWYAC